MALLWIDGFDHYGTNGANITTLLNSAGYIASGYTSFYSESTTQANIGYSLSIDPSGSTLTLPFGTSAGIVVGFRAYCAPGYGQLLTVLSNDLLGSIHTQLRVWSDGQNAIAVGTEDGDIIASSPANSFLPSVWYYIEVKYIPHATAGTIIVKANGIELINVTGVKTNTTGQPNTCNQVAWGSESNSNVHHVFYGVITYLDDVYVEDTSGTSFSDFLGDVVVHTVFPASDASPNTMIQTGGSSGHYTAVNEQAPDGDTSYVSSNSSGTQETFTITTLPTDIIDVLAVSVNIRAKKAAIGDAMYEAVYVYNGNEQDSPAFAATSSYSETHYLITSPPGGGSWTLVNTQNSQIGVKIP